MIELKGKISNDYEEGLSIKENNDGWFNNLASKIGFLISDNFKVNKSNYKDKYEITDEYDFDWIDCDISINNIKLKIEVFEDNNYENIKNTYEFKGLLDIYTELIGYSEYTITGSETINFKINEIDLDKFFEENCLNKYVNILIVEEDNE